MTKAKSLILFLVFIIGFKAQAGLLFNYSQLALKDLDQMTAVVNEKIRESKKTSSGKVVPLKEALQAIYARPNEDGMIEKVVAPLRSKLDELEAWEKTVSQLTDEAIHALKNPRAFKPVVQVTYAIFLENLVSELKPYINQNDFERQIVQRIRDAKIQVTKEAANELRLRTMKELPSPSQIAEQALAVSIVSPSPATVEPPEKGK